MADKEKIILQETDTTFIFSANETERLKRDIYRSDIEKLRLFTQMLKTNNLLKKARITHK